MQRSQTVVSILVLIESCPYVPEMKERQTFRNHNGAVYSPIQRRITSSVPNKFDVYVRGKQPSFVVKWRVNITCRKMSPISTENPKCTYDSSRQRAVGVRPDWFATRYGYTKCYMTAKLESRTGGCIDVERRASYHSCTRVV